MVGSGVLVRGSLLFALLFSILQISGCRGVGSTEPIQQQSKAPNPPSITFAASPSSIASGASATLTWTITGATTATIDGVGTIQSTGSMQVQPKATTTYTLHAEGPGGNAQATATVTVAAPAIGDFTFTATPSQILAGDSVTLSWAVANATSVSIDNNVGTFAGPTGSVTVSPTVTTSYTATATGPGGTKSAAAKVIVGSVTIQQFTASPTSVTPGQTSTLTWNVKGADSVTIDNGVGSVAASGTANVAPSGTTTYTLTATHAGHSKTATVTITVNSAVSIEFNANPTNISAGQSATLSWTSTNATSVNIDNGVGAQPANGSVTVTPSASTTYTATATGTTGTASGTATVTVVPVGPPGPPLAGMFRYKFDLSGTGANTGETALNLATVNQDDHVKNFAFLMSPAGEWRLSPAFDLTFAKGNEWTRTHQMTVASKDDHFTRDDLLRIGELMDVPKNGAEILRDVEDALGAWDAESTGTGLSPDWQARIRELFRYFV